MWNRTGLPAVFPLQVMTAPGADYFLRLIDTDTGTPAMAAYIEGGDFFRVLVPPGTFSLHFAFGQGWQGETALFGEGEETRRFEFPEPLTFEITGFRTKSGHLVDITRIADGETAQATSRRQDVCQGLGGRVARERSLTPPQRSVTGTQYPGEYDGLLELDRPLRVEPLLDADVTPEGDNGTALPEPDAPGTQRREFIC